MDAGEVEDKELAEQDTLWQEMHAADALLKRMRFLAQTVHRRQAQQDHPDAFTQCTCSVELRSTPALCGACAMRQLAQLIGYELADRWLRTCMRSRQVWKSMRQALEAHPPETGSLRLPDVSSVDGDDVSTE